MEGEKRNTDLQYGIEELVPIVAKLSRKMNSGESTSITYEKAEQLMGAVIYCIREWEAEQRENAEFVEHMPDAQGSDGQQKMGNAANHIVKAGQKISPEQAYELGFACVTKKVKRSLALYNRIMESFDSYGNQCLYDTMVRGMPEFFKWYDPKLAPQNTILTLDYPVLEDLREYTGVDAIWEYLCCIRAEQKYLGRLPRSFVIESLKSYCDDYQEMIENLRQIVDGYSKL